MAKVFHVYTYLVCAARFELAFDQCHIAEALQHLEMRDGMLAVLAAFGEYRHQHPVAQVPAGNVLTFVDLGPRLVTVTHHNAIAGPYHRNGQQIIDVMHAWRGTADNALRTVRHYRIDYVLICPNLSESTIYRSEAPHGFYMQLMAGKVPAWMRPVPLPPGSPYRMWRVVRPSA